MPTTADRAAVQAAAQRGPAARPWYNTPRGNQIAQPLRRAVDANPARALVAVDAALGVYDVGQAILDPNDNAAGEIGGLIGGTLGGALGASLGGPAGAFVGSIAGDFVGRAVGDWLFPPQAPEAGATQGGQGLIPAGEDTSRIPSNYTGWVVIHYLTGGVWISPLNDANPSTVWTTGSKCLGTRGLERFRNGAFQVCMNVPHLGDMVSASFTFVTNGEETNPDGSPIAPPALPSYAPGTEPQFEPRLPTTPTAPSPGTPQHPDTQRRGLPSPTDLIPVAPLAGAVGLLDNTGANRNRGRNTSPNRNTGRTPQTQNQGSGAQPPTLSRTKEKCPCNAGVSQDVGRQLQQAANPTQTGLAALLAQMLEVINQLGQIATVVGVGAFPATMPANLNGKATGTRQLSNLAELGVYNVEAVDSVMGQYPMQIQTENGTNINIDTASDAQQEIIGMLMSMAIGQGLTQQGVMKTLVETTGIKQQSLLAANYAQANAEYLGYRGNRTKINAPNTYTPGAENILDMLNPGNVPMQGFSNDESEDLQTCLRELKASAAIIRAAFFRTVDPNDIEGSIRQRFDSARATRDGVQQAVDDLDEFIQSVESGYGLAAPYGREPANYPRIYNRSSTNGNQP